MAKSVLVDTSFLVALLNRRDADHRWASARVADLPLPWRSCDAVLSEAFFLLSGPSAPKLAEFLRRGAVVPAFDLLGNIDRVLALMEKYADVPMSLADACLVRMTETLADPIVLTTDADFQIYRRHSRHAIPCMMPLP
jgi:uncharacterized protein